MKRIIAMAICLCMVLGGLAAFADVRLPEAEVSQQVLQQRFLRNVQAFLGSIDLDSEAVSLDIAQRGRPMGHLGAQSDDGVVTVSGNLMGRSAQLQLGQEAVCLLVDGQVYRMSYADLQRMANTAMSAAGSAQYADPEILSELMQLAVRDILMPSVTMESQEGGTHIAVNLSGDTLTKGLIRFGDDVVANERYLNAVAGIIRMVDAQTSGPQAAFGRDYAAELRENWPAMKQSLAQTQLPFLLNADINISDGAMRANGVCQFSAYGENVTLTLSIDSGATGWTAVGNAIDSHGVAGHRKAIAEVPCFSPVAVVNGTCPEVGVHAKPCQSGKCAYRDRERFLLHAMHPPIGFK